MCLYWQGLKDSNPHQRFWRPSCYHCTKPLYWRLQRDLNPWPPAWQAGVLLFWTMEPYWCRQWDLNPYEITPTSPSSWRVCHSTITAFITCPKGFYHIDHTVNPLWQSSQIHQEQFSIAYVFSFRCFWLIWNSCPHFVVQCTPNPFSEDGIFRTILCLLPTFSVKYFLGTNISLSSWWCRRGLNPQTPAWKAGNSTNSSTAPFGTPNGTRTRITGLRGQPPIPIRGWEHL